MRQPRYLCIHGHFYQPPRENPWLGMVEVQDSAAPYHDWNERIARECYSPNIRARHLDGSGHIVNLLNNYAWMSFNFGPTLLQWMSEREPEILEGIIEADELSRQRRNGHGNALAQVYNHVILPLASPADKQTQVRWGIADFQARFGRDPEGMWLAETAVDLASLEVLAEAGIAFTVLAPRQAKCWRKLGEKRWHEIPGGIDPSRAYLCKLPSGRSISLFFYDGIISQQVAFERLLDDGDRFLARLHQGFDDHRDHAQLMHIATDGESYGHHHPHGDMALAYVLQRISRDPDVQLTNYGEFLALHPPEWEVEIHENSSWSCVHGVERWRSNCECRMRPDWHQRWRDPLRRAFNTLKEGLDDHFISRGRNRFEDPWAARDGYIDVMLKPGSERVQRQFLRQHGRPDLSRSEQIEALKLLEIQRDALFMFTSCGWFFDEISGIETVQCLLYAARAIHLARQLGVDLEPDFLEILSEATSNLPQFKDGRDLWEQIVRPSCVDIERVLAHRAISMIYANGDEFADASTRAFELVTLDKEIRSRGNSHLAVGRIRARSKFTWEEEETSFVVIHFGGLDFHAVLNSELDQSGYETFKQAVLAAFRGNSLADVTNLVARSFPGTVHRLDDLFRDEQRR
ncbi:MAG: alpha-amylase/alpha-mannosidase, partial [Planctomycetes bacterium SCN 63-9]